MAKLKVCLLLRLALTLSSSAVLANALATLLGQTDRLVTVDSKLGRITGLQIDLDMIAHQIYSGKADVFLGIPYAEAPIGKQRFQVCKALRTVPDSGSGYYNATTYKPMCPQPIADEPPPLLPMDEDCLYLNVIRTADTMANAKLPVMVWIHGGGMVTGSYLEYTPIEGVITNLVSRGVIVVTLNYRLGMLGFFTTFTREFPSNLGLRDQLEALKWVRANIDSFGGDSKRVTIFGESSGGCSVSFHTYSPMSRGYFDQAISESNTIAGSREYCMRAQDHVGSDNNLNISKRLCNTTNDEWKTKNFTRLRTCLQALPWDVVFSITFDGLDSPFSGRLEMPGPGISEAEGFLPNRPALLLASRRNIPIMIGACADEGASTFGGLPPTFFNNESFRTAFLSAEGVVGMSGGKDMQSIVQPILLNAYGRANGRQLAGDDHLGWLRASAELASDAITRSVQVQEARLWRDINGNRQVYLFNFEYATDSYDNNVLGMKPVLHTQELPYITLYSAEKVFNVTETRGLSQTDRDMINWMGTMWTNFAKYGNPTPITDKSLPFKWQTYTTETNNYLAMNISIGMKNNYYSKADIIFNNLLPSLALIDKQQYLQPIVIQNLFNKYRG